MNADAKEGAIPMRKKLPFGLDVPGLFEWGYRAVLGVLVAASFYLNTVYAKKADTDKIAEAIVAAQKKYDPLEERIDAQRAVLTSHMVEDAETRRLMLSIRDEVTAARATQAEQAKNIDANFSRVFRKLDNLPTKPNY